MSNNPPPLPGNLGGASNSAPSAVQPLQQAAQAAQPAAGPVNAPSNAGAAAGGTPLAGGTLTGTQAGGVPAPALLVQTAPVQPAMPQALRTTHLAPFGSRGVTTLVTHTFLTDANHPFPLAQHAAPAAAPGSGAALTGEAAQHAANVAHTRAPLRIHSLDRKLFRRLRAAGLLPPQSTPPQPAAPALSANNFPPLPGAGPPAPTTQASATQRSYAQAVRDGAK